jgi:hypothetical protein
MVEIVQNGRTPAANPDPPIEPYHAARRKGAFVNLS